MSTVDGRIRCDICKQPISGTDLFIESAQGFEGDRAICRLCIDDYKKRSGESEVVGYEQVYEYTRENGNRLGRDGSSAGSVLDELLE